MLAKSRSSGGIWDSLSQRRSEERVGKVHDALVESIVDPEEGLLEARAWWQAPEVDGFTYVTGSSQPGQIIKAYIDDFDGCDFHGRILSGPGK